MKISKEAIEAGKKALEPAWSGGHDSKFPTPDGPVPIHVSAVARVEGER